MAEILSFPMSAPRSGAVRAALDAVPAGRRQSGAVADSARTIARYTVTHHQLDAFTRQCESLFKRASRPEAEVIPFPQARRSGRD